MPRSKVSKIRMFRDSSFLNKNRIKNNYLKRFHVAKKNICESNSVSGAHLEFLLWCYDLEFFTIDYAAKEYEMDRRNMAERYIYILIAYIRDMHPVWLFVSSKLPNHLIEF